MREVFITGSYDRGAAPGRSLSAVPQSLWIASLALLTACGSSQAIVPSTSQALTTGGSADAPVVPVVPDATNTPGLIGYDRVAASGYFTRDGISAVSISIDSIRTVVRLLDGTQAQTVSGIVQLVGKSGSGATRFAASLSASPTIVVGTKIAPAPQEARIDTKPFILLNMDTFARQEVRGSVWVRAPGIDPDSNLASNGKIWFVFTSTADGHVVLQSSGDLVLNSNTLVHLM